MTGFARIVNGTAQELSLNRMVPHGDYQTTYEVVANEWNEDQRRAAGVVPIVDDPIPANKEVAETYLENDNGTIRRRWTLRDAPFVPISDRQFFHALALGGTITQAEALAAVQTGTVPASMQTFIDAMPNELDRFNASMIFGGATEFKRDHAMVEVFRTANGWTAQQVDDLWRFAATL